MTDRPTAPLVNQCLRSKRVSLVLGRLAWEQPTIEATANAIGLAESLAPTGAITEILWVGDPQAWQQDQTWPEWRRVPPSVPVRFVDWRDFYKSRYHDYRGRSYAVYQLLRQASQDAGLDWVLFPERGGGGYYALLAKRMGLALAQTRLAVVVTGPSEWDRASCFRGADLLAEHAMDYMEQRCADLADDLFSLGPDWSCWPPPNSNHPARPALLLRPMTPNLRFAGEPATAIKSLAYFGRMVPGGGLKVFCEALSQLHADGTLPEGLPCLFLGQAVGWKKSDIEKYLAHRTRRWGHAPEWIESISWEQAIATLRERNALAVIPDTGGRELHRALACCAGGVPFVAGDGESARWLLDEDSHRANLVDLDAPSKRRLAAIDGGEPSTVPDPRRLAARIHAILRDADTPIGRPRASNAETAAAWRALIEQGTGQSAPPVPQAVPPQPRVTVCLTCYNRSRFLAAAVASIEGQTYPNLELLILDDGSTDPETLAAITHIEKQIAPRGWRVLRLEHLFCAAARNRGATAASGEYLVFMDDDNIAEPGCIATLVKAAENTAADVLTCGRWIFYGEEPSRPDPATLRHWLPVGATPELGLFLNALGDMTFMVRREVFLELGGFETDYGVLGSDREFLIRTCLSGHRLEVVPEILYHYRCSPHSLNADLDGEGRWLRDRRFVRRLTNSLPPNLGKLPRLAYDLWRRNEMLERLVISREARLKQLLAVKPPRPNLFQRLWRSARKRMPW
ncbi:MAG: glycosyltransferase family 2 protein [Verrucomicrobiae bacterium]|nr:glycosyltransferase family 2 protein [Verrucomicrobiae bacterium]